MSRPSLYRLLVGVFGTAALTLYLIGVTSHDQDARHFYIPSILCALITATCLVLLSQETTIERTVERTVDRVVDELAAHRAILGESIGAALAASDDDDPPYPDLRVIGNS